MLKLLLTGRGLAKRGFELSESSFRPKRSQSCEPLGKFNKKTKANSFWRIKRREVLPMIRDYILAQCLSKGSPAFAQTLVNKVLF